MKDDSLKAFLKEVAVLAIPLGIQQVINLAVNLIDNLMIGSLGEASISGVAICGNYMWFSNTMVNGLASGAVVLCAQDWGNGNKSRIKKLFSFVIVCSIFISAFFFVLTHLFPTQILQIYSDSTDILGPGVAYLNMIKYSFIFANISNCIMLLLRSVRVVKLGLYNSLFSCFSNVFFNWVFIYGHLGAPAMGAAGAALGTVIARFIEFVVSSVYLLKIDKNIEFKLKDFDPRLDSTTFKQFVVVTIPLLIIDVLSNLVSSAQTMITGRISTYYVSANSIVHMSWNIPNVFSWGIAMAASIIIGNSLGKDDFKTAERDSHRFIGIALVLGSFSAIMVQVVLPILLQFYNVTENTKILARQMGYSASFTVFFLAFQSLLCNGVIKSGGHTKKLLYLDLMANWFIAIPLGIVGAFVLKWPAAIIYLVLRSGNFVKATYGIYHVFKADWMQNLSAKTIES